MTEPDDGGIFATLRAAELRGELAGAWRSRARNRHRSDLEERPRQKWDPSQTPTWLKSEPHPDGWLKAEPQAKGQSAQLLGPPYEWVRGGGKLRLKDDVTADELEWLLKENRRRMGKPWHRNQRGAHLFQWPEDSRSSISRGRLYSYPLPISRSGQKWVRAGLLIDEAFVRNKGEAVWTSGIRAVLDEHNEDCNDEDTISWSTVVLQLHEKGCAAYRPKGAHGKYCWTPPLPVKDGPGVAIEYV